VPWLRVAILPDSQARRLYFPRYRETQTSLSVFIEHSGNLSHPEE